MAQYIVTLKQRDQLDGFYADMKEGGYKLISKRPISRCTHYDLTESQADTIAGDSRVLAVELHPDDWDGLIIGPHGYVNNEAVVQAGDFYKGVTSDSGDRDWGKLHCAGDDTQRRKNSWGSGSVTDTAEWFNNGKHVDVVICDDNAAYDCAEWLSPTTGLTRYVTYDWYANHNSEALSIDDDGYTAAPSNYTKYYPNAGHTDYHGTHVTGTIAGQYYGWAPEANIYNIQCISGMDPNPLPTMIMMDYLRAFHRSKAINPETGHRNPTITNHSWGSGYNLGTIFDTGISISDITEIVWRGTTYNSSNPGPSGWTMSGIEQDFGIGQTKTYFPYYSAAMAADVEDAIEDGVVVIGSAGNSDFYVATDSTSPDWNNIVQFDTSKVSINMSAGQGRAYYNRGSAPGNAPGAICVGSMDKASDFSKSSFSCYGEAIDVWAPGTHINSAFNPQGYNDAKYGGDNYFYAISGTSMASPQVTGVAACLATGKERFTNSDVKSFLQNYCKDGDMTFDNTYTPSRHAVYQLTLTATTNGWDVSGPDRYNSHVNAINPTIEIFEGDTVEFVFASPEPPLFVTSSPVTGLTPGSPPQGQVSWFPHQGTNTSGTFNATPGWPGSAGDYYYACGDMGLSFTSWPQGILRVHPPLHYDDSHIGAGSVNKYLLATNPRPGDVVGLSDYPSRWYQQQLKGRRRDVEATSNNPPNMQLYPRENVYHRGFNIHQLIPTYLTAVSPASVNEGDSFTTTITTTNVADNTILYWELTGVSSADFSSGALTGTATVSNNSATFSHTVDEDGTTEGAETATIKVYSDSARSKQVGSTLTVAIADTSDASQTFTSTGTFTVPTGVTTISVYAVGGGGGSGFQDSQGTGAGGATVWADDISVTPGEILIVGVGQGGDGGVEVTGNQSQPPGTSYSGSPGTTSYVQRQSNNEFIVKAYGGGSNGGRGGTGEFYMGNGKVIDGGDAYNYSNTNSSTGQKQWTQGGTADFKNRAGTGGSHSGAGGQGTAIKFGTLGEAGQAFGSGHPYKGGDGGLYGAGGGAGGGSVGSNRGGAGANGGVCITWGTPIGGGDPHINGRHSINFISKNDPDYIEYTPAASDEFQLGTGAWTIEFWHKPNYFNYTGNNDYRCWQWGNATFVTGVDTNGDCVWKIGADSPSYAERMGWYVGTGESPAWQPWDYDHWNENSSQYWYHWCVMRNGSTIRHFYGGSRHHPWNGTDYDASSFNDTSTAKIRIGGSTGTYGRGIHGKISNIRVVKGHALYWNDHFDPSHFMPYREIDGTVLLAANGSSITDAYWGPGKSAGSVTTSGTNNATYSSEHPFDQYDGGI